MAAAAVVVPLVMAGLSIANGISGSGVARQNADATRAWAKYNAAQARRYARFNAESIEKLAEVNSLLVGSVSEINASMVEALAQYNATLRVQAAEYNAQLMEKEARLVWEAQELDQMIFQREAEHRQKQMRSQFASAGIEINVGSPVDYVVDQATQANLESFIIRHNADLQMAKLLDAAALGRWQGEAEAAAMIYQSQLESTSIRTQGGLQQLQINSQAAYDAVMARYSGETRAWHILHGGEWEASQYEIQASQAILGGLFQGGSWASRAYQNYDTVYGDHTATTD